MYFKYFMNMNIDIESNPIDDFRGSRENKKGTVNPENAKNANITITKEVGPMEIKVKHKVLTI